MRHGLIAVLSAAALLLCGCSQSTAEMTTPETLPELTTEAEPSLVYYTEGHQTVPLSEVSTFQAALEEKNCIVQCGGLEALPSGADLVVLNSPREDITKAEAECLDRYMDDGGHFLLLFPADDGKVRFKYLERSLERYCIRPDYDRITETESSRMQGGDPAFPEVQQVYVPSGMNIPASIRDGSVYLHECRSFHFETLENFHDLRLDAILETADSAEGTPCGGVSDDPVSYRDERLMTMLFSRDTMHSNAFMICVGASDFLLDENYALPTSAGAQSYVLAAVDWAAHPNGF